MRDPTYVRRSARTAETRKGLADIRLSDLTFEGWLLIVLSVSAMGALGFAVFGLVDELIPPLAPAVAKLVAIIAAIPFVALAVCVFCAARWLVETKLGIVVLKDSRAGESTERGAAEEELYDSSAGDGVSLETCLVQTIPTESVAEGYRCRVSRVQHDRQDLRRLIVAVFGISLGAGCGGGSFAVAHGADWAVLCREIGVALGIGASSAFVVAIMVARSLSGFENVSLQKIMRIVAASALGGALVGAVILAIADPRPRQALTWELAVWRAGGALIGLTVVWALRWSKQDPS